MHYKTEIDINYIISFTLSSERPQKVIDIIKSTESLVIDASIEYCYFSINWIILVAGKHDPVYASIATSKLIWALKPVADNNIVVIEKQVDNQYDWT